MATASKDLRAYIFSAINISSILAITGAAITGNRRVYAGWPNEQPVLGGIEPPEGWITFHESSSSKFFGGSNIEDHTIQFNFWNTLQSNNDDILDIIDALFDRPPVDQYGYEITSDWIVLLSQRTLASDVYEQEIKMYRRICNYIFRLTKTPYRVGP